MAALERHAPPDHTLFMGGGRHQQFVGEWLARGPDSFLYGANSGVMGFAFPAAIAAAFGAAGRTVTRGAEVEDAVAWLLAQETVALLDVHIDLDENRSLLYGHDIGDPPPVTGMGVSRRARRGASSATRSTSAASTPAFVGAHAVAHEAPDLLRVGDAEAFRGILRTGLDQNL